MDAAKLLTDYKEHERNLNFMNNPKIEKVSENDVIIFLCSSRIQQNNNNCKENFCRYLNT